MGRYFFRLILLLLTGLHSSVFAAAVNKVSVSNSASDNESAQTQKLFQKLDDRTQDLKLHILDLNRDINKYAAKSKADVAQLYKGGNRANFGLDFVFDDYKKQHYLDAINRYHAGRDFGVILSKYETALKVANIYLDYGLYHYSQKIFKSLLGDEDTAVASLARFYLAKHNYLKHYWDDALAGFESVTDGLPQELMDKKRIMQAIILQDRKRHDEVIKVLSDIPSSSPYYQYARFNIAMSYLRKGWWSDTEENIHTVLESLKGDDAVTRSFRDRLYIALGYYQLQREYYREAYDTLNKVNKGGQYGYKAQLGMGIVAAEQGNYKDALTLLNTLKDTYSNQLVTDEAYIVIPFVLESIGSLDNTIKYYADSGRYFAKSVQEVGTIQSDMQKGALDNVFMVADAETAGKGKKSDSTAAKNKQLVSHFIAKLDQDREWNEAMQNIKDIDELQQHLDKLDKLLHKSGNYAAKPYKQLQQSISQNQQNIARLLQDYRKFSRTYLADLLDHRKQYFISYLNQSQFALARIYDNALGDKTEIVLAGKTVTEKDVRQLYRTYLAAAVQQSRNRRNALMRLAELEFNAYEQYVAKASDNHLSKEASTALDGSVNLLETALRDYPDDKTNDKVLYQLAVAYDKQMHPDKVNQAMRRLVDNYPQSRFYTEVQFKLGENYLTSNESIDAELAYSAAVSNGEKNSVFYQRALYKRGWSRLRQSEYEDALGDFFEVLALSHYDENAKISAAEHEFMQDVLRAISLCFSDMGGLDQVNNYFHKFKNPKYAYVAYEKLGELYESEGRGSDAVELYNSFIQQNDMSPRAPYFMVKIINAWQAAKQPNKELEARTLLESKFNLKSSYWKKNDLYQQTNMREALETNVTYMAAHYHGLYQKSHKADDLQQAKYWYEEFKQYASNSKNPAKTYFMYAELLSEAGEGDQAVAYYEKANVDTNNSKAAQEAAYAAILTTDNILKKASTSTDKDRWLFKKADYSLKYVTDYPKDQRSPEVLLNALQGLYARGVYNRTLAMIKQSPVFNDSKVKNKIAMYEANCLFELKDYSGAESIYQRLYKSTNDADIDRKLVADRLAGTIYKQGELADKAGNSAQAIDTYLRVVSTVPDSKFAATASYDAATALLKAEKYTQATNLLEAFLKNYPGHRLQTEVNNKLALIYSKQSAPSKSAAAFMVVANDPAIDKLRRRDALWQAAESYNEAGNIQAALDAYQRYSELYNDNHEQIMEVQAKLADLYGKSNNIDKQMSIYRSMVDSEAKIRFNMKTNRTQFLTAHAALKLMEKDIQAYNAIVIKEPLKETLGKKKKVLTQLVDGLTRVSNYAIEDTTTWALYNIGEAYREFSRALLSSPRPRNLKGLELEQYEVLLEEQAYPFEEKALGFYKENLDNVKTGVYNEWIKNSLRQLARMEPARYDKKEKQEAYFDRPLDAPLVTTATQ